VAYNNLFALDPLRLSIDLNGLHGQATVKRTHANNIKLRLTTGATGHDEGNAILIRS
jgi:hypothetical protein